MMKTARFKCIFPAVVLTCFLHLKSRAQEKPTDADARYESYMKFHNLVSGAYLRPVWMADGTRFWFAGGSRDSTVIYAVDPVRNAKRAVFDVARLRKKFTQLLGHEPANKGVPFTRFEFVPGTDSISFQVEGKKFRLRSGDHDPVPAKLLEIDKVTEPKQFASDSDRFLFIRDHNLWTGDLSDANIKSLTADGTKDFAWGLAASAWSPDGKSLLVKRSDNRNVHHIPLVDYSEPLEKVDFSFYAKTNSVLEKTELYILDVASGAKIEVETGGEPNQYIFPVGWKPDGSEIVFMRMNRVADKLELLAADPKTGKSRIVLTERQKTFVGGLDFITEDWHRQCTMLKNGTFLWLSERDGWKHIYLYDWNGKLIRRLTKGAFPVVEATKVDDAKGWIYFRANADDHPYDTQLWRVNLKGKGLKRLTDAHGSHLIRFSPSGNFFLDAHSSPQRPPVVELRRSDGFNLGKIAEADIAKLVETGWRAPENFVAKAADGKTDLYGLLYKPFDFDASKKYPVVEFIYGGPFMTIVPRGFLPDSGLSEQAQALAQTGYITFLVDGRGTTERGKAFQDVVYGNIGKYEIPDHVAVLKQLASGRPYMDMEKVGIMGHSWGGYFAIRAMLTAADTYKAGIASAPGELTEGAEINEPYMGLPSTNKAGYDFGINASFAANLKGKLLFIHGTSDTNAPFSVTVRMIDALIKAGKPYDLLMLPHEGHFFEGTDYVNQAIRRYFDEHLKVR